MNLHYRMVLWQELAKGSGNFALIIKGRAAHAGREHHLGRNAIAAMARFAVGLDDLNGQRDGVTFNVAKIDGGGAVKYRAGSCHWQV